MGVRGYPVGSIWEVMGILCKLKDELLGYT